MTTLVYNIRTSKIFRRHRFLLPTEVTVREFHLRSLYSTTFEPPNVPIAPSLSNEQDKAQLNNSSNKHLELNLLFLFKAISMVFQRALTEKQANRKK